MSTPSLPLHVKITRRTDGSTVFRCERPDGTATWQRHDGHQAQFFPFHDLTHFAVETTLELPRGFYGLIAEGWDVEETTGKGERGRLPEESIVVEHIVGLFDRERGGGDRFTAEEFNMHLRDMIKAANLGPAPTFMDTQLDSTRVRIDELHRMWAELPSGMTLELVYNPRHSS